MAESEDLEQNLKSLVLEAEKESDREDTEDTEDESNAEVDENSKQANGLNGFKSKSLSPSKKPVINPSDVGYLVMINGPEKHKNKIKKHCNLM